jgi:hypothetical protein
MKIFRNGDWTFYEAIAGDLDIKGEEVKHQGEYIFATGEATNHHHVIKVPRVEDMKLYKTVDGGYIVDLREDATVTHPEHSMKVDLAIPKGMYKLFQRREKDWFSLTTRKVID